MTYYKCELCGRMVEIVKDSQSTLVCCGQPMKELIPGTTDAATEKHVPVVEVDGSTVTVKVGEVAHPMLEEHHIEFISIETKEGVQRKALSPGEEPVAVFVLTDSDELIAAYEHCNLHGLWKSVS
ncbi:MAG: desulfoferrodoxin family protein [Lachnospiraceae bacterium]